MILGIQMSKVKIAILETKIERLVEKQKELPERVRSNEKFIAGVGAVATLAIAALGFIGTAEADEVINPIYGPREEFENSIVDWDPDQIGEWVQKMRDWKSEKEREPVEDLLNSAIAEFNYGSDGATKSEELLQLPSDGDKQGT